MLMFGYEMMMFHGYFLLLFLAMLRGLGSISRCCLCLGSFFILFIVVRIAGFLAIRRGMYSCLRVIMILGLVSILVILLCSFLPSLFCALHS